MKHTLLSEHNGLSNEEHRAHEMCHMCSDLQNSLKHFSIPEHREHTVSAETACVLPPGDATDWQVSAHNSSWLPQPGANYGSKHREHTVSADTACILPPGGATD